MFHYKIEKAFSTNKFMKHEELERKARRNLERPGEGHCLTKIWNLMLNSKFS